MTKTTIALLLIALAPTLLADDLEALRKDWIEKKTLADRHAGTEAGRRYYEQATAARRLLESGLGEARARQSAPVDDRDLPETLLDLLPIAPGPGEDSRKIGIRVDGGGKIPGIEVGLPGSIFVEGSKEVTIQRNADGTVEVKIQREGWVGIDETLYEAKANIQWGTETYGLGTEAGVKVGSLTSHEETYLFDPTRTDDQLRMLGLLAIEGVTMTRPLTGGQEFLENLLLSENLVSEKTRWGSQVEGSYKESIVADLLAFDGGFGYAVGYEILRGDDGQQKIAPLIEAELGLGGAIPLLSGNIKGKAEIQPILDVETGRIESLKIEATVVPEGKIGRDAWIGDIKKKSGWALDGGWDGYAEFKTTLTLDAPSPAATEAIGAYLADPSDANLAAMIDAVGDGATFEVKGITHDEVGVGGGLAIGAASQGAEVEGHVNALYEVETPLATGTL